MGIKKKRPSWKATLTVLKGYMEEVKWQRYTFSDDLLELRFTFWFGFGALALTIYILT